MRYLLLALSARCSSLSIHFPGNLKCGITLCFFLNPLNLMEAKHYNNVLPSLKPLARSLSTFRPHRSLSLSVSHAFSVCLSPVSPLSHSVFLSLSLYPCSSPHCFCRSLSFTDSLLPLVLVFARHFLPFLPPSLRTAAELKKVKRESSVSPVLPVQVDEPHTPYTPDICAGLLHMVSIHG